MSEKVCRQIVVSNNGTFTALIYGKNDPTQFESLLSPKIEAGVQNVYFDLNKLYWWRHFDTFDKDSENEAVYVVEGSSEKFTITFKELRPIGNTRQITVSNNGTFTAHMYLINVNTGLNHEIKPEVKAGDKDITFNLTEVDQLKNRDMFQLKVASRRPYDTDLTAADATWLMFTNDSKNEALYSVAGVEGDYPSISFKQLRPISEPTPIGNARQITISNSGAFTASIYTVNTKTEHILEDAQADWLKDGENFRLKVVSAGKAQSIDATWLTYTKNSRNQALYDVAGSSSAPTITFKELRPIRFTVISETLSIISPVLYTCITVPGRTGIAPVLQDSDVLATVYTDR
ncbi:hypothetical protein BDP27DRAFT_1360931 [Rhodocollybia butyracea]|uniref:Uncharacterized protein n=1 Tax=Rhodocollybia butyracea TaxID=206335 RepID=A0A9P5UB15_9AGAR|nr:hypothetical protein BDP27DRAFT_1360931 [Rhodocollybia butyracea]